MKQENFILERDSEHLFVRKYINQSANPDRKIILLHGAGFSGEETWKNVIPELSHWHEIYVPDFRGAGKTIDKAGVEKTFKMLDVVADLKFMMDHEHLQGADVVGYCFGGDISMILNSQYPQMIKQHLIIEPGLHSACDHEMDKQMLHLQNMLALIEDEKTRDKGINLFLDIVSPRRKRININFANQQTNALIERPKGLAHTLVAVIEQYQQQDRWGLIEKQGNIYSVICEYSPQDRHELSKTIKNKYPNTWHVIEVSNATHSFPFINPEKAAEIINETLQ
jgi:pimeloyl-ACP methyl ester carboxylesterase